MAGLAVTSIHVDLAAVVVLAWIASHRFWLVFGSHGVNPISLDADGHEINEVIPHRLPANPRNPTSNCHRCDVVPEQHFGSVHIPDTGEHRLVHQQRGDRNRRTVNACPGSIRIGVSPQRVRTQPSEQRIDLRRVQKFAGIRPPKIGRPRYSPITGLETPPHLSNDFPINLVSDAEGSVQPEMNVHDIGQIGEFNKQVFARRVGAGENSPVEAGRFGRKSSLRTP